MPELTTLCYLEDKDRYLMLHRVTKKHDLNHDKWIGVGGHVEYGESPEDCVLREVREETGLVLTRYRLRGIVTFLSERGDFEYMFLFTADAWEGTEHPCSEGVLEWMDKEKVWDLNLWEGDRIFFRLLEENAPFFSLKIVYDSQDRLKEAVLDGKPLELFDIVKEDGTPSGLVRERGVAHRDGSLHRTVHMWIVRKGEDGTFDILLQKRAQNKDCYPGCYDISSAGHISAGQTPEEASVRELWEELGIRTCADRLHFIGTFRVDFDAVFHGQPFCDREIANMYVYTDPVDIRDLKIQREELDGVMWLPLEKCLEIAAHRELLPNCLVAEEVERVRDYLCRMS